MTQPMLARSFDLDAIDGFLDSDEWVMEQKLDGHRVLMHVIDGQPTPYNRNGEVFQQRISREVLADFTGSNFEYEWIFDGELLGGTDYWIFDMLRSPVGSMMNQSWSDRRYLIDEIFNASVWQPFHCHPTAVVYTPDGKRDMLNRVLKNRGEGIMLKNRNAPYFPGARSAAWVKVKFVKTIDCIVTTKYPKGKQSISVALIHDGDPREMFDEYKPLGDNRYVVRIGSCTMSTRNLNRVKVGDVVELRYLYCGAGGRLYQPAFIKLRDDKEPIACTTDQLMWVNKDVIE